MRDITFDQSKPFDIICLGRVTIDLNPIDYYQPLADCSSFRKYLGGSPANIAVGLARLGKRVGFIGKRSDDQFGDFLHAFFQREGIDVSHFTKVTNGTKTGLTFTEILSEHESSILMYRDEVADLYLDVSDVDEDYIKSTKLLLISGTALCRSPSREAAMKAMMLAERHGVPVVFDVDYRSYVWKSSEEIALTYHHAATQAQIILGSREEYDLMQALACPGKNDEETAAYWFDRAARICVIKHGKQGSTAYTKSGGVYRIKPFPVKAIKGFGGGDGYAAAFLYGLMEQWEMMDCLEYGSACASMLVNSHSCADSMPNTQEINEFIKKSKAQYGEDVARG